MLRRMTATENGDHVLRAMTDNGSFRVLVADTTETSRAIVAAQEVPEHSMPETAGITTAAILIRETMAPANRVQVIYQDALGSQLVGDAYPEGKTRGLVRIQDDVLGVMMGEGGSLHVERIIRAGNMHRGIVATEEGEGLVATLHRYFLQSEQVATMLDLACRIEDGEVKAAAGYVIQLLPELTDPPLDAMKARLQDFGSLSHHVKRHGAVPETILGHIMRDVEYTMLASSPVRFHCPCDRERVLGAATALGREEIQEMLDAAEEVAVTCHYCQERYLLGVDDYRRMLADE